MASIDKISNAITRRTFLAASVNTGLFMSFGGLLAGCTEQEAADTLKLPEADLSKVFSPAVWFNINAQGAVTINIAKAEMGQHVGTALARVPTPNGVIWLRVALGPYSPASNSFRRLAPPGVKYYSTPERHLWA